MRAEQMTFWDWKRAQMHICQPWRTSRARNEEMKWDEKELNEEMFYNLFRLATEDFFFLVRFLT